MTCSICMEDNSMETFPTQCNHYFHKDCITEWFNSQNKLNQEITCPMCRCDLKYEQGVVEYYEELIDGIKLLKRLQNVESDIGFYPDGTRKYILKIDRTKNEIIGGKVYNKENTTYIELSKELITKNYPLLLRQQEDSNYYLFDDL